jgi:group I intron endonuclease
MLKSKPGRSLYRAFCYICNNYKTKYNMAKIAGIYKITSPSQKVYIGQSFDLELRFRLYSKMRCTGQRSLYNSLKKYGYESHRIEVIHCLPFDIDQPTIDNYERLYIQLYKECGVKLLNLKDGGSKGKHCEATKLLISKKITGRTLSEAHRKKMSENFTGAGHPFFGKKATESHKQNISKALKGKTKTVEHRKAVSEGLTGKYLGVPKPEGHGEKVSRALKGRTFAKEWLDKIGKASIGRNVKAVLQYSINGILIKEWASIVSICETLGYNSPCIVNCAKGRHRTYKGFTWKYN